MKLEKGFYLIGRARDESKTFIISQDRKRFDTIEEAEQELEYQEIELLNDDVDIQILEVEE